MNAEGVRKRASRPSSRGRRVRSSSEHVGAASAPWHGAVFLGGGWLLYAGPAGPASRHAHHAFQFVRALHGTVRLLGSEGRVVPCAEALVPPDTPHASEGFTERALLLYVDPDSELGRRIPPIQIAAASSASEWRKRGHLLGCLEIEEPSSWLEAASLVQRIVEAAGASGSAAPADKHPAVREALRVLPALLGGDVRVGALAGRTGLSTSRFSHVFNEQVGTSIRAYVRWLRLERAARVLEAGGTLTRAACAAGFSDAAHLTRTFRRMFGLAPSDVMGVARWVARPSARP